MAEMSQKKFLTGLPEAVVAALPPALQSVQWRHPWGWLIQFHFGEPRLHYEVSGVRGRAAWEVAFHFEARDKDLNRYLLLGFRRNLFEIKDILGETVEAEMWDRGWAKVYEVVPQAALTEAHQAAVAQRLAAMMTCLHPIFVELRDDVRRIHR